MKYKKTVLKNGLRIVTVPMKDNPTVTVLVLVGAGSKYETKEISGVSHFLEHLCFKGTVKRPTSFDITKELDGLGAQSSAFTGHELTGYYAKAQSRYLSKLINVISDIYLNSTLPPEEIKKEKGVILDELSMFEDNPQRQVGDLFMEALYGDQPAGWDIGGSKKTVKAMLRENIVKYRAQHYVAGSTVVVVSGGGFNEEKIIKDIEKKFANISVKKQAPKKKVIESQVNPNILVKNKKTDQTHLILGVRTFDLLSKNNVTLKVLSSILGGGMSSRLFQKLRDEMGVGYYVYAHNNTFTDHGFFSVGTGVNNKRVTEVIEAILEELKKTTEELVDEKELKKVKDYLTGNLMLGLESSDDLAEYYGIQEVLRKPVQDPKELAKKIRGVTAREVRTVARKIFKNERLNLALIGPFKSDERFKKILKF